jgi:pyruvyl transferase EpsO
MAHFLYGCLKANQKPVKDELHFLRNDSEKIENQNELFGKVAKSIDWCDLISYQDEILLKKLKRLIKFNKFFKISRIDNYIFEIWYKHCWELVHRCINEFSAYEKVITSRLHGHILTCLLERNSILLNNSYGKNKAYYELWTKELAEYIN